MGRIVVIVPMRCIPARVDPTIDYELRNGDRQTSIFGFVAHYALN